MNYLTAESKKYYINNTIWKRKLPNDLENLRHFNNILYDNVIIFHFDFMYSIQKSKINMYDCIFIDTINICLRYYNLIKKLYPYNNVNVVIWFNEHVIKLLHILKIDYDVFKQVIDIIPNFAIFDMKDISKIKDIDNKQYKHIFYGSFIKINLENSEGQNWNAINGQLFIKPKF